MTFRFAPYKLNVDGTGNDPAYTLPAVCRAFHTPARLPGFSPGCFC